MVGRGKRVSISIPKGERVYAVGDIHGMADLLGEALAAITADIEARPVDRVTEIFLGDYVDRGPDSRAVIEMLAQPIDGRERVCLMGNHEDAMRNALHDGTLTGRWLGFGGSETCISFGVDAYGHAHNPLAVQAMMQAVVTDEQRAFLDSLKLYHVVGNTLFVHAGVRPGIPLDEQTPHDLIWIREPFLSHTGALEYHVVHGHTPVDHADHREWRTNIDTGAVFGGTLTVAAFEDTSVRFFSVGPAEERKAPPSHGLNSLYRIRS